MEKTTLKKKTDALSSFEKVTLALTLVIFGASTLFYVSIGYFMRPIADDYCVMSVLKQNGFWGTLRGYFGYRYGSSIFSYLIYQLGPIVLNIAVYVVPIVFSLISFYLLKDALAIKKKYLVVIATSLAFIVYTSIFVMTPNKLQSLYWLAASCVYFWSFLFLALGLLSYLKFQRNDKVKTRRLLFAVTIVLVFVSFGFSEVFALSFLPLSSALLLLTLLLWKKQIKDAALLLSINITSLCLMFFSPARVARTEGAYKGLKEEIYHPTIKQLIVTSFDGTKNYFFNHIVTLPNIKFMIIAFLFLVLISRIIIKKFSFFPKNIFAVLVLLIFALPFSIWFSFIPGYYTFKTGAPDRTFVVPTIYVVMAIVLLSLLLAKVSLIFEERARVDLERLFIAIFIFAFLIVGRGYFNGSLQNHYNGYKREFQFYEKFAKSYDEREVEILAMKSRGVDQLELKPLFPNSYFFDFTNDKNHWRNTCPATYYGIKTIKLLN